MNLLSRDNADGNQYSSLAPHDPSTPESHAANANRIILSFCHGNKKQYNFLTNGISPGGLHQCAPDMSGLPSLY